MPEEVMRARAAVAAAAEEEENQKKTSCFPLSFAVAFSLSLLRGSLTVRFPPLSQKLFSCR
jgi:hypothetical protein